MLQWSSVSTRYEMSRTCKLGIHAQQLYIYHVDEIIQHPCLSSNGINYDYRQVFYIILYDSRFKPFPFSLSHTPFCQSTITSLRVWTRQQKTANYACYVVLYFNSYIKTKSVLRNDFQVRFVNIILLITISKYPYQTNKEIK
jgi:hypothetical protein